MDIRKFGFAGALVMLMAGNSAMAADLYDQGYRGSLKDDGYSDVGSERQWYVRLDLGYGFNQKPDLEDDNGVAIVTDDIDDNVVFGGGIGYHFMRGFRGDLTIDHRFDADVSGYYPAAGPANMATADINSWVGLANFYYDLDMGHRITPYVGVGIGFAHHNVEGVDFNDSDDTNFAWALMAGAAIDLKDSWKLDIGYRYLNMGDMNVAITPAAKATKYPTANYIKVDDLESHEIRVGLRYSFGCWRDCDASYDEYK